MSMRQHLASLVAVFLALLIGVLVGVSLSRGPRLEKLMESVLQENDNLDRERRKLGELNDLHTKFEASTAPLLVQGRLANRHVAVVMTCVPEDTDLRDEIIAFLKLAGALQTVSITFPPDFAAACQRRGERVLGQLGRRSEQSQDLAQLMATEVGRAVAQGHAERLATLSRPRLVTVDGELSGPMRLAIVVGGSDAEDSRRTDMVDEPLIGALLEGGLTVVGCESSETPESYIRAYQKADISTVDHVNTVAGLLSAVVALSGEPGHYGIKPTAALPFPVLAVPGESTP